MLGKLTGFELKKMVGTKFFLLALCLLLVLNLILTCGLRQYQDRLSWMEPKDRKEFLKNPENRISFWDFAKSNRQYTRRTYWDHYVFARRTRSEWQDFENAMRETYGEKVFDSFNSPPGKMLRAPGYLGGRRSDYENISTYMDILRMNQGIQEARDSVVRSAKALGREAVQTGDSYGIRRNLKALDLYEKPQGEALYPVRGWPEFFGENAPMLLVCLLVLLACGNSFAAEREKSTWLLLQTSKYGKGMTLIAKYLAGALVAAVLTLLFQAVSFGGMAFYQGYVGGDTTVAAMESFRYCPYGWTVKQYALVMVLCQLFGTVTLSVLLNTVSAFSKNGVLSYILGALLLGGSLALAFLQPKQEIFSGPLALTQPGRYFASYHGANLFGFPVPWVAVHVAAWSLISLGGIFLAKCLYYRKRGAV